MIFEQLSHIKKNIFLLQHQNFVLCIIDLYRYYRYAQLKMDVMDRREMISKEINYFMKILS